MAIIPKVMVTRITCNEDKSTAVFGENGER